MGGSRAGDGRPVAGGWAADVEAATFHLRATDRVQLMLHQRRPAFEALVGEWIRWA
ncbi:MAG: hypothetical protein ACK4YP_18970 [Myxococcota bacterium]